MPPAGPRRGLPIKGALFKKNHCVGTLDAEKMQRIVNISIDKIKPDPAGVFALQGIPAGTRPPDRVKDLYDSAEALFYKMAAPIGIMAGISIDEFAGIYPGKGLNEPDTPLQHIYPRAGHLALFVFTLGAEISREIENQYKNNNLATAYMLDAVASYSADKAAEAGQKIFLDGLLSRGKADETTRVLLYSPGYCGWHVSGQGKLFDYLKPEEIGITLNGSFLMIPLKSISGVLVAGKADIHCFTDNYPFCAHCQPRNCREARRKPAPNKP
jgi:hypothetical protein